MSTTASPLELFGTDEPPPERRYLAAGALSAWLEDGNLRDIRFGGVEIVRAINYLARDESWGTFKPFISNLRVFKARPSSSSNMTRSAASPAKALPTRCASAAKRRNADDGSRATAVTIEKDHGRIETRRYAASANVGWIASERADPGRSSSSGAVRK